MIQTQENGEKPHFVPDLGDHLKIIRVAWPDQLFFWTKKHQNFNSRIGKFQYYNFLKFQNHVKIKNCNKHLPPVQKMILQCIINFHLFLSIGNTC